jgi:glucokinase
MQHRAAETFPFPCLLADVGGTNARFATVHTPGGPLSPMLRLDTAGEADFAATVRRALAEGGFPAPRSLLLAAAGPVADGRVTLSNAATASGAVVIDGADLAAAFQLAQGILLNDFEALCLALPFLSGTSLRPLGSGLALRDGPLVVVGPGTGLGVGGLLRHGTAWLPVASEGGHIGIGPEGAEESRLWPHLGGSMTSAEDVLSGRGLTRLYRAVSALANGATQDEQPAAIAQRALEGTDPRAEEAVGFFFRILARFAGDMALTFGAKGGMFIGGGIAPRFASTPWLKGDSFAAAARSRGRASHYLADIPVQLITAPDAALQGLAAVATDPGQFTLNFEDRLWC